MIFVHETGDPEWSVGLELFERVEYSDDLEFDATPAALLLVEYLISGE